MRLSVILATLAVLLSFATTAEAARTEFFGIAQGVLDVPDRQGMRDVRVQTSRFMLSWRDIERVRGSYDWSKRDRMIGGLAQKGIRSVLYVWGSPRWVNNGAPHPPISSSAEIQAWQSFLKAAVARYGPGGRYWANGYRQRYGADAKPLPVQSWQVWNEPNLRKFFTPGSTVQQTAQKYAKLLAISHTAITSRDPRAKVILAGMPGIADATGSSDGWDFLDALYGVVGVKGNFDAAALHPYACTLDQAREGIVRFRAVMKQHGDGPTPLWLAEVGWGSGPPDAFCKNKGLSGQRDLLFSSFRLILQNRASWNVQRLFWFLWRDPEPGSTYARYCSICGTAGLLRYDRSPKPAYYVFKGFTAETTPPEARINSGPGQGSFINDPTPTFSFASNEPGSILRCRYDGDIFKSCSSPFTRSPALSDGTHTLNVKAIDAPGNESAIVSRSFTVDTVPPQTTIASGPSGSTADPAPTFTFNSSESGSAFRCRFDSQEFAPCSGPGARHTPSTPLAAGGHRVEVRATDRAKNTDPTPASRTFTVTAP